MPYMKISTEDGQFAVYKQNADGKPEGDVLGTHPTEDDADAQIAALYAQEDEAVNEATGDIETPVPPPEPSPEAEQRTLTETGETAETPKPNSPKVKIVLRESSEHVLSGAFPNVPIAPTVDKEALFALDSDPMFLTLDIVPQIGAISENGLIYNDDLVNAIVEQAPGLGGIRGHISDAELATAYPVPDVYWCGAMREGNKIWAKAYIPPGATREDMRLKKITGGRINTSIFAHAAQEMNGDDGTWYARDIELEGIDLASPQRAALRGEGNIYLTRETKQPNTPDTPNTQQQESEMTTTAATPITIQDVPKEVREQLFAEFRRETQLSETEKELTSLRKRIKEMGDVTAHIKLNIPDGADPMERIGAMTEFLAGLQAQFGQDVTVEMLTNMKNGADEMAAEVEALDAENYDATVDSQLMELTKAWQVASEKGRAKIATLHTNLKKVLAAEMGTGKAGRDREKMKTVLTRLWNEDMASMVEMTRDAITGGNAFTRNTQSRNQVPQYTDEQIKAARARTGI